MHFTLEFDGVASKLINAFGHASLGTTELVLSIYLLYSKFLTTLNFPLLLHHTFPYSSFTSLHPIVYVAFFMNVIVFMLFAWLCDKSYFIFILNSLFYIYNKRNNGLKSQKCL